MLLSFAAMPVSLTRAQAQTEIDFVSNTGETDSSSTPPRVVIIGSDRFGLAQSFHTGHTAGGYTLTSVVVPLGDVASGANPRVSIYSASGSNSRNPGTSLYVLTNPSNVGSGRRTFTAPANAQLDADTDYFVVFESRVGGGSGTYEVKHTDSSDQTGRSGWSIANWRREWTANHPSWYSNSDSLKIAIKGRVTNNSGPTGSLTISGLPQVGAVLTARTDSISDADGLTSPGWSDQWIRVDGGTERNILHATNGRYALREADLGKTIKVR